MQNRMPFGNGPSSNRSVEPPGGGKTFARASDAQSAISVSPFAGQLVPKFVRAKAERSAIATGPPWLYAYVLLDRKSYELDRFFRVSVRSLDHASGVQIHFQDIGNPRVHGEVYKRIRSKELMSRDEREADIYMQEVTRLGGESHKRLMETEQLANLLGIKHGDLPCIAFRTSPFTAAIPLRIKEAWFDSRMTGWAFIEILEGWLGQGITWAPLNPSPTVDVLLDPLSDELSKLSSRIDQAVQTAAQKYRSLIPEIEKNTIDFRGGFLRIKFAGETVVFKRPTGAAYLVILLSNPGQGFLPITLQNMAYPPDFAIGDDTTDESGESTGVEDDVFELYKSEKNRFKLDPNQQLMNDEAIDARIKDFTQQAQADSKTINTIKTMLRSLEKKVDLAKAQEDFERAQELDEKHGELEKVLQRLRGRSKRTRTFSDKEQRANQSVPLAIRRTLKMIADAHPQLHLHLTKSIDYVPEICYNPETPIIWTSKRS